MEEKNYTLTEKELFDLIEFAIQKGNWASLFCMRIFDDIPEGTAIFLKTEAKKRYFTMQDAYEDLSPKAKQILNDWEVNE